MVICWPFFGHTLVVRFCPKVFPVSVGWCATRANHAIQALCAATAVPGHLHLVVEPHGENFSPETKAPLQSPRRDPVESAGLETMELRRSSSGGRPIEFDFIVPLLALIDICTPQRSLEIILLFANRLSTTNTQESFYNVEGANQANQGEVCRIRSEPHEIGRPSGPVPSLAWPR
jgi:hypothetical protein